MASYMDYEFQQLVYTFNEKAEGISSWKEYLEGLTKQQTSDIETATQQASYDISGAYANYKKAQLNLLQNQQLGAGFKEQLGAGLQSSYASAYDNVQSQLASNISNIASQYDKLRSDAQKSIQESASYLDSVNRYLYEYMSKDIGLRDKSRESGGLGYYETDTEGNTTLTPYGKAELSYALLNPNNGQHFTDYVADVDKKTYDWLMNNLDLTYGSIAGLEPGTRKFSKTDKDIMIKAADAEKEFAKLYANDYDKNMSFASESEKLNYYTSENINRYKQDRISAASTIKSKYDYNTFLNKTNRNNYNTDTINNEIKNNIQKIGGFSEVKTKTIAAKTTMNHEIAMGRPVQSYNTTVTISTRGLTSAQKELLNEMATKDSKGNYVVELYLGSNSGTTNSLIKSQNRVGQKAYSYDEFFKKLSK